MIRLRGVEVERVAIAEAGEAARTWADPSLGRTGFFAGAAVTTDRAADVLARRFLEHYVVRSVRTGTHQQYVAVFDSNLRSGTAQLATVRARERDLSKAGMLGLGLALHLFFSDWPHRKLYGKLTSESYARFQSGNGRWFEHVMTIPSHILADDQRWLDEVWVEVSRDRFRDSLQDLLGGSFVDTHARHTRSLKPFDRWL